MKIIVEHRPNYLDPAMSYMVMDEAVSVAGYGTTEDEAIEDFKKKWEANKKTSYIKEIEL